MLATLRQRFLGISLAHVSLVFIGLTWVLPFQLGYHQIPIPSFYQEWGTVVFCLCAMLLLVTKRYWQQPEIPKIVLLPVGLFLLVWLQFALGKMDYPGQVLLVSLYFLWAALMIMLGQRLRVELGLPLLATVLAAFLLFGCELSALTGVAQYYGWRNIITDNFVALKTGDAVMGNTGQPNHFADYIALGLVSLGLLRIRWQLRVWQAVLLALPLLFVLVLSGSRSSWLYLLCLSGMAFLWQRRDKANTPLLRYSLLLVLGFGLMHFVVQIPWLAGSSGSVTVTGRLMSEMTRFIEDESAGKVIEADGGGQAAAGAKPVTPAVDAGQTTADAKQVTPAVDAGQAAAGAKPLLPADNVQAMSVDDNVQAIGDSGQVVGGIGGVGGGTSLSLRLYAWYEAWLIFNKFPMLGAGFGQFAWQHFLLGPSLHNLNVTRIYNNAHNFVLQIAAEMGLAGLSVLLATLALWFWQMRSAQRTIYHWWGCSLLAVLGIHSLLEFPLWYAFFLGIAALALGAMDFTAYRPSLKLRGVGRWSAAVVLLFGVLYMSQMWAGYRKVEEFNFYLPPATKRDGSYELRIAIQRLRKALKAMPKVQDVLFRPYVEFLLAESGWDHVADNLALNERVMHFLPNGSVIFREAILLARSGRQAEAQMQMERVIWANPERFPEYLEKMRALASVDKNPARFPALLEFALQKNQERERMGAAR